MVVSWQIVCVCFLGFLFCFFFWGGGGGGGGSLCLDIVLVRVLNVDSVWNEPHETSPLLGNSEIRTMKVNRGMEVKLLFFQLSGKEF